MSNMTKEFNKGDLLHIDMDGKAQWGFPNGYPLKSVQTITLMEEQMIGFSDDHGSTEYYGNLADPFEISEGQTYTINWDGTVYVCVCVISHSMPVLGNLSVVGAGNDTGEPFFFDATGGMFITLNTSKGHTISVKTTEETVIPMAPGFLPQATSATYGTVKQMPYLPNATGDAPTAENFNQLVRGLKSAGLMRRS